MVKLRRAQRIQAAIGPILGNLPERIQRRIAGPPIVVRDQTLAPDMQIVLKAISARGGIIDESPGRLRKRQAVGAVMASGSRIDVTTRDLTVAGLQARHYVGPANAPLAMFLHGGGFVFGDLETHDRLCRQLCKHAGVHVLAIEYRLAPEFPFPAAADDAALAWKWTTAHAAELGADPKRIAIAGDSAGGNLATVTAQTFANTAQAPIAQLLIYPTVDHEGAYESKELYADNFFLTREAMTWFREHYIADGFQDGDVRLRPIAAHSFANQPPAIVVTAGFDPLRDEGEAYARLLADAGNRVVVRRFDGLIHGFANMTGVSRSANDAVLEIAGMLRAFVAELPIAAVAMKSA
ncbi:MAG: alpha/beta hydrolase [Kofleriaceae bacterium]